MIRDRIIDELTALLDRIEEWARSQGAVEERDALANRIASDARELLPHVLLELR